MARQTVETFWARLERNATGGDVEVEYQVLADYHPGVRGRTYGPPEECYPPEGPELDITGVYEVTPGAKPRVVDLEDFLDSLTSEQFQDLEGRLFSEAEDACVSAADEAADRKFDEARDRMLEGRDPPHEKE
jgi:hypothetical protein